MGLIPFIATIIVTKGFSSVHNNGQRSVFLPLTRTRQNNSSKEYRFHIADLTNGISLAIELHFFPYAIQFLLREPQYAIVEKRRQEVSRRTTHR
jgi:hypothetical protein